MSCFIAIERCDYIQACLLGQIQADDTKVETKELKPVVFRLFLRTWSTGNHRSTSCGNSFIRTLVISAFILYMIIRSSYFQSLFFITSFSISVGHDHDAFPVRQRLTMIMDSDVAWLQTDHKYIRSCPAVYTTQSWFLTEKVAREVSWCVVSCSFFLFLCFWFQIVN